MKPGITVVGGGLAGTEAAWQIASAGRDMTIRFWDITAPQEGPRLSGPGPIRMAAFSGDSQRLTAIAPRLQTASLG